MQSRLVLMNVAVVLAWCFLATTCYGEEEEVIYKNELPDHREITIARHKIRNAPPPPAVLEAMRKDAAARGGTVVFPEYVCNNVVAVTEPGGGELKTLWAFQTDLDEGLRRSLSVPDFLHVRLDEGCLLIAYKFDERATFANVVTPDGKGSWNEISRARSLLAADQASLRQFITGAEFHGSLATHDLTVRLSVEDFFAKVMPPLDFRFSIEGGEYHWVRVAPATAPSPADPVKEKEPAQRGTAPNLIVPDRGKGPATENAK